MTTVRKAKFSEHKDIMKLAKLSKYTRDFSNHMFSGEVAYDKGWIAVVDDVVLGISGFYCVRHKVRTPSTTLYFIGVHPDAVREGIGQSLIKYLINDCPNKRIELNCMKENTDGLQFYEKLDFKIVGEGLKGLGWHLQWEA